jgi:hypothetical protein
MGGDESAALLRARASHEDEPLVREAIERAIFLLETPATLRRAGTIAPPSEP